jgi:hypothetical protein
MTATTESKSHLNEPDDVQGIAVVVVPERLPYQSEIYVDHDGWTPFLCVRSDVFDWEDIEALRASSSALASTASSDGAPRSEVVSGSAPAFSSCGGDELKEPVSERRRAWLVDPSAGHGRVEIRLC